MTLTERVKSLENRVTALECDRLPQKQDGGDPIPEWMLKEDGTLADQFLSPLDFPISDGQIHLMCPSGIGDVAWVWAKFAHLAEKKYVKFWFPNDDVKRVKPYAEMVGMNFGFSGVDSYAMFQHDCEWEPHHFEYGSVTLCQANLHVESGRRLEEWNKWLPIRNPAPHQFGRWKGGDYLVMHMGHSTYGGGNWPSRLWARVLDDIQTRFNLPVMPIGAFWDREFCDKVCERVTPKRLPCMDKPLDYAIRAMLNARAMIGVDSGLAIMAKYLGVPTLQAYPAWLVNPEPTKRNPTGTHMPNAWEMDQHDDSRWCLLDEVLDKDAEPNGDERHGGGYRYWFEEVIK